MPSQAAAETLLALVQSAFYFFGTVGALFAFYQYSVSVRQKTAETLLDLEQRFASLGPIVSLVDPASGRYKRSLAPTVDKSLKQTSDRTPADRRKIQALDAYLRFLLLLTGLERNWLLNRDTLGRMYHYWFVAVIVNPQLSAYTAKYFPKLWAFIEHHGSRFTEGYDREWLAEQVEKLSPAEEEEDHEALI